MKDANGTEITIGARVKHLYPPGEGGDGRHCHKFSGPSEVVRFTGACVEVKAVSSGHIPVHCPALLVVVQ